MRIGGGARKSPLREASLPRLRARRPSRTRLLRTPRRGPRWRRPHRPTSRANVFENGRSPPSPHRTRTSGRNRARGTRPRRRDSRCDPTRGRRMCGTAYLEHRNVAARRRPHRGGPPRRWREFPPGELTSPDAVVTIDAPGSDTRNPGRRAGDDRVVGGAQAGGATHQRIRTGRDAMSNQSMTAVTSFRTIRRDSLTIFIVAHLARTPSRLLSEHAVHRSALKYVDDSNTF